MSARDLRAGLLAWRRTEQALINLLRQSTLCSKQCSSRRFSSPRRLCYLRLLGQVCLSCSQLSSSEDSEAEHDGRCRSQSCRNGRPEHWNYSGSGSGCRQRDSCREKREKLTSKCVSPRFGCCFVLLRVASLLSPVIPLVTQSLALCRLLIIGANCPSWRITCSSHKPANNIKYDNDSNSNGRTHILTFPFGLMLGSTSVSPWQRHASPSHTSHPT